MNAMPNAVRQPLISIITVLYNGADTLEHTIKSVINQSYGHIEFIIVDGRSTDGSLAIIERYRQNIDIFVSETDNGIYDAMNKGLSLANGDWAYFLGADDVLASTKIIEELVTNFTNPANIYYGLTYLKSRNRPYVGKVDKWKLVLCNISHQAIFYPRSIYKAKSYVLKYKYFADHIYNLELFGEDSNRFVYLPKLVSIYNDMGRSSQNIDVAYAEDIVDIIKKNFGPTLASYYWVRREVSILKNKLIK